MQRIALASLANSGRLQLTATRLTDDAAEAWLELRLVAADGRRFACAAPLRLAPGEHQVGGAFGLDPGSWAGEDGPLGGDALAAMRAIELAVHGGSARVVAVVGTAPGSTADPAFAVEIRDPGLVRVGPWREWRLRLLGNLGGERGELDLIDAEQRRWPLFLDQPGGPDPAGRWRARGPARWVLRLADGEAPPGPATLAWKDGQRLWNSSALTVATAISAEEPLPAPARGCLAVPRSAAWSGAAFAHDASGWQLAGQRSVPEALAPVIAWRAEWTGFRGPQAVSWPEAAELDRVAAGGAAAIDLLPEGLAVEQGAFRFGLSPWTGADEAWRKPRDLWTSDQPWQDWLAHARQVVARCRAAPGLATWSLGLDSAATGEAETGRLRRTADALAGLVAALDRRPLLARHPQLAEYARRDPKGAWYAFSDGAEGWAFGPPPLVGPLAFEGKGGSDGGGFIAAPVPPGGDPRVVGLRVPLDVNLFNLDRIEFDAGLDGGGEAAVFAWVTDHHNRWWQQRLVPIAGDGGWQTVGIDCSAAAAWICGTPGVVWSDDIRRRIRAFGIAAYVRGSAPGARLRIDRIRRLGWPRLAQDPTLGVLDLHGDAEVARWTPIAASFRLSQAALNPFDPESADVVGEIEGPDGSKRIHPAYWYEPYRLDFDGTTERAVPDGAGSWRWRWTPPTPGTWRWRIVARLKVREAWLRAESPWQSCQVGSQAGGMVPVRVDPKDPRWFSDVDGRFWFPIGLNLRSPGDVRTDGNLDRERAFTSDPPVVATPVRAWRSADWQARGTRAYERWFPIMRANGMDWARVWMSPWWCGLEWRRDWDDFGGLVWYSQANAARMDRVVELASASGVRLQVELMNHGMVGDHADRQWIDSPYNRANGGPCRNANEWFRSEEVWRTHEKRLRYTLARWGGSTTIAAWSLCSEMEFTATFREESGGDDRGHSQTVERWIARSLAWLSEHEVLPGRPATIHFSHPWSAPETWRCPGLGFSNSNIYTAFQDFEPSVGHGRKVARNLPLALECYLDDLFPPDQLKRPTLIGEWGGHWSDNDPWLLRGELRTGLWLQACTPYAGDTGFWWWLWLDVADRWRDFAGVAAYIKGEDPRGIDWQRIQPPVRSTGSRIVAQGMRCADRIRLYCWPRGYDQDCRRTAHEAIGTARIDGNPPGSRWQVRRFDCDTGVITATTELAADPSGILSLPIAGMDPDAAFKLVRKP